MNFKKLNEQLENIVESFNLNEISTDLKKMVLDKRQQQLKDIEKQMGDNPVGKLFQNAEDKRKKMLRANKIKYLSKNRYLITQFNDIKFYVTYIGHTDTKYLLEVERNSQILDKLKVLWYRLTDEITKLITHYSNLYFKQEKIKDITDINIRTCEEVIHDILYNNYHPGNDEPGAIILRQAIKQVKPDDVIQKNYNITHDIAIPVHESQLNELEDSTVASFFNKREKEYDKASVDAWNLRFKSPEGEEYTELEKKSNKLKNKIKDIQDNIKGKNADKRAIKRGTWIFTIFDKLDAIINEIQLTYKNFKITVDKQPYPKYHKLIYIINVSIPMENFGMADFEYRIYIDDKQLNGQYKYGCGFELDTHSTPLEVSKTFKDTLKNCSFSYGHTIMRSNNNYFNKMRNNEEDMLKDIQQEINNKLNTLQEVVTYILPKIRLKLERRANRQESEYISLFYEKSQWGLDIDLKVMKNGYQVVSHIGGYDNYGNYDPNQQTDKMSGIYKDWKKAIEQAAKNCLEEDDLVDDLLCDEYSFADNEYAQYFYQCLQQISEEINK